MRIRVASAGTGKTTNLVARYLELIGEGVRLRRIAGATFTRAAAFELRQRVGEGIETMIANGTYLGIVNSAPGDRALFEAARRELGGATLTTISGLMIRFLRLGAPSLGLDPEFVVRDESEAGVWFEEELRSHLLLAGLGETARVLELARLLFARRSLADEFTGTSPDAGELLEHYGAALARYRRRLGETSLGPADVETMVLRLLALPALRRRIGGRYTHLLIDEFQDVNPLQGSFFERLEAQAGITVEVVGDPKQSIYAFRDADVTVFRRAMAQGELLPPLTESRRHSRALIRFLNHATGTMGALGMGFDASEAPPVTAAGPQAQVAGSVEVHWVQGRAEVAGLRNQEARTLAGLLQAAHATGVPWRDMAVLARAHGSLELMRATLAAAGIPAQLARGRGFFGRPEIRDVAAALRTGVSATGAAFGTWLRSPFAQLDMAEAQAVMAAADPETVLAEIDPSLAAALARLRELVLLPPVAALKALLREPLARGRSFVTWLDGRQRDNVDALLLRTSRQAPSDLELLLDGIDRHAAGDVAEVPQSGAGVSLQTIHNSKGLEWPLVAIFDAGRGDWAPQSPLLVEPGTGVIHLRGEEEFAAAATATAAREKQELYRLFYVATSRARDHLLITGSRRQGRGSRSSAFAELLDALGLGADEGEERDDAALPAGTTVRFHQLDAALVRPPEARSVARPVPPVAEWTARIFSPGPRTQTSSPSGLRAETIIGDAPADAGAAQSRAASTVAPTAAEPSPVPVMDLAGMLDEAGALPNPATAVGTLVHQAIALDWQPRERDLLGQEVMFPFDDRERGNIVEETLQLLGNYSALLGGAIPALDNREEDRAELPIALPAADTVWQGTIDRLYRVGDEWVLEDYKTDASVRPEAYHGQLGLYLTAVREILGIDPRVRLVYLRRSAVIELDTTELEAAVATLGLRRGGWPDAP